MLNGTLCVHHHADLKCYACFNFISSFSHEICYDALIFQLLLSQPVTSPAVTSAVATPSSGQPSVPSTVNNKVDESQVFLLL
jgi:hypothetical protein